MNIAEVAGDLGVSNESLRKWVQQAKTELHLQARYLAELISLFRHEFERYMSGIIWRGLLGEGPRVSARAHMARNPYLNDIGQNVSFPRRSADSPRLSRRAKSRSSRS